MIPIMTREEFFGELERIRQRPGMFIGCKSMTALWHFIEGLLFCLSYSVRSIELEVEQVQYLRDFDEWIRIRYKERESLSTCNIILKTAKEEEKAFDLFFLELDLYKIETKKVIENQR